MPDPGHFVCLVVLSVYILCEKKIRQKRKSNTFIFVSTDSSLALDNTTTAAAPGTNNTTAPPRATVTTPARRDFVCYMTSMTVFIPVSLVPNSVLSLKDPTCQLQNNGTHHVISFAYDQCGTSQTFYTDYILVENEITVHSTLNNQGLVIFAPDYTISLQCSVARHQVVNGSFQAVTIDPVKERGYGSANFEMREFTSDQYQDEITQYPVTVPLNRELFLELALLNSLTTSSGIKVNECKATPSPDPNDPSSYLLITNGCSVSPAVHVRPTPGIDRFRFSVQAFHFSGSVNHNNLVYIHCSVSDCRATTCDTACPTGRRRRSAGSLPGVTLSSGAHIVTDN